MSFSNFIQAFILDNWSKYDSIKGTSLRIDHKSGKNWGNMSSMLSLSWLEPENPGLSSAHSSWLSSTGNPTYDTRHIGSAYERLAS